VVLGLVKADSPGGQTARQGLDQCVTLLQIPHEALIGFTKTPRPIQHGSADA
jgi:hypothetical protein